MSQPKDTNLSYLLEKMAFSHQIVAEEAEDFSIYQADCFLKFSPKKCLSTNIHRQTLFQMYKFFY